MPMLDKRQRALEPRKSRKRNYRQEVGTAHACKPEQKVIHEQLMGGGKGMQAAGTPQVKPVARRGAKSVVDLEQTIERETKPTQGRERDSSGGAHGRRLACEQTSVGDLHDAEEELPWYAWNTTPRRSPAGEGVDIEEQPNGSGKPR